MNAQRGVIAAGSEATAAAGAEVLAAGGNAVDAAVAACFATGAGEPTLTSLAGGGMMIHRDGATGEVEVCDFFSNAPTLAMNEVEGLDFFGVHLDFGPTTQEFHIGAGAAAVPGVIPGLCAALERWGALPLTEVIAPACRLLREGVVFSAFQASTAVLLAPILTQYADGRRIYAPGGKLVGEGDRFRLPQLADTLEALAAGGGRPWYDAELVPQMVRQFGPEAGGLLTQADFDRYQVRFDKPLTVRYRDHEAQLVPPPAAGGSMIGLMLRLLESEPPAAFMSPERIRQLAEAMAVADEARHDGVAALDERFARWRARYRERRRAERLEPTGGEPASVGNTTHVSVIDAEGNAAAITFSFGEGNGHVVDHTGIVMNNLLGEADLQPRGFGTAPTGQRLATMMSPTLVTGPGDFTALGSGGSNRIRSALTQAIVNLVDHGFDAGTTVSSPRVHYDGGVLNAEVFGLDDRGAGLEALAADVLVRFEQNNLFFGGVHLAQRTPDGRLHGAGDPRRGGAVRLA